MYVDVSTNVLSLYNFTIYLNYIWNMSCPHIDLADIKCTGRFLKRITSLDWDVMPSEVKSLGIDT